MYAKVRARSTGLPTGARPRKPLPKEKWISETTKFFLELVEQASVEGDKDISDMLFELTDYEIDGLIKRALYKVLLYHKKNHIKLALDCRDIDGNVWVAVLEWDSRKLEYVRKATLWTTVDACAKAKAGVVKSPGSQYSAQGLVPPSMPPSVDWVKAWCFEDCYEEYNVSDDEDWVMIYKGR
ncbi:hypothetical protein N7G274_009505 [Stereocaulon virgatum]|uniref:Uncharacterized protein n=1 Tax=Stereocaulon virgatum TaxID=373712 RepID=A0ABR3ZX85_9LECA